MGAKREQLFLEIKLFDVWIFSTPVLLICIFYMIFLIQDSNFWESDNIFLDTQLHLFRLPPRLIQNPHNNHPHPRPTDHDQLFASSWEL